MTNPDRKTTPQPAATPSCPAVHAPAPAEATTSSPALGTRRLPPHYAALLDLLRTTDEEGLTVEGPGCIDPDPAPEWLKSIRDLDTGTLRSLAAFLGNMVDKVAEGALHLEEDSATIEALQKEVNARQAELDKYARLWEIVRPTDLELPDYEWKNMKTVGWRKYLDEVEEMRRTLREQERMIEHLHTEWRKNLDKLSQSEKANLDMKKALSGVLEQKEQALTLKDKIISEKNKRLEERDNENKELLETIARVHALNAAAISDAMRKEETVDSLQNKLQEAEELIGRTQTELKRLRDRVSSIRDDKTELRELRHAHGKSKHELEWAQRETEKVKLQLKELDGTLRAEKERAKDLNKRLGERWEEREKLLKGLEEDKVLIDQLEEDLVSLRTQLASKPGPAEQGAQIGQRATSPSRAEAAVPETTASTGRRDIAKEHVLLEKAILDLRDEMIAMQNEIRADEELLKKKRAENEAWEEARKTSRKEEAEQTSQPEDGVPNSSPSLSFASTERSGIIVGDQ
jgi:chromosome segregation ATPase